MRSPRPLGRLSHTLATMQRILPPATIGLFGGGQLGRMSAIAARQMGYRVRVLDPAHDCPAAQVADEQIVAPYDDLYAAERLAQSCDVLSFEFENVPADALAAVSRLRPVHPSSRVLETCRHRLLEKNFLQSHGIPVARFEPVRSLAELRSAIQTIGLPAILKSTAFGYDGKGQVRIDTADRAPAAWDGIGHHEGILEAVVPFDNELSILIARRADGATVTYDPALNTHRHHILDLSIAPAPLGGALLEQARTLAERIAEALELVGLLCVELFAVGGQLLVNELAPRPHNSGHHTLDAGVTSQFEQHIRAICGLPLGDCRLHGPAAMANLLGHLWTDGEPDWAGALEDSGVKLHLYGKSEARPGRKMGHLTVVASTAEEAAARVLAARERLTAHRRRATAEAAVGSRSA